MHIAKVQAAIQEDIPLFGCCRVVPKEGEEGMENPVNTSSSSSPSPSTDKRVVSLAAPSASDTTESSGASVNIDERSLLEGMCFAPDFVYKHYVVSLPGSGGKGDATRSSQRQLAHHLLNSIVGANSGTKGLSTIRKIQEAAVEGQLFGPTDPRRSDDFIAIWTSLLEKYVTPTVMQWTQGEKNEKRLLEIVDLCIAHAASTTPRASEGTAEAEGTVTPPSPRSPKSVCLSMPSSPSSSSTWSMTAQDVLIAHLTAVASNQNTWRNLGSPDLGSLGSGANGVEYKYWSLVLHDTLLQLVMAHALPSSSSVGKFEWIQTDAERQTEDAFDEFARLLVASSNLSEEALLFHQVSRRGCAFVKKVFGSGSGVDYGCIGTYVPRALPVKYHTVCHDAAGYLYTAFRLGPGYTYVGDSAYVPRSSWESFKNWFATRVSRVNNFSDSPYAGQLRGITFWQAVLADSPPAAAASS